MAGDVLYGRRCKLTIAIPVATKGDFKTLTQDVFEINGGDDPSAPGLRIQFKIAKSTEKDPNSSEITVTNLAPSSRGRLQQKGMRVVLEAGYASTGVSRLFVGDSRTTDHMREGPSWNTVIKLGDGERSYRHARVNESFSPGTGAGDIARVLANASGIGTGNVADFANAIGNVRFDQGYVAQGQWSKAMGKFVAAVGWTWSIQNNALQFLAPDGSVSAEVPDITPDTGLVGSPEMGAPEKKGKPALVKFKFLLQPVAPGGLVHLKSERYDGFVKAQKVAYTGDTHGNDWYTEIEGVVHGK